MVLILSVTVAKVWPGAITGTRPRSTGKISRRSSLMSGALDLRVGVAQRGQVSGARARVQFGQQRVIQLLGLQFRHAACGIVDVPEDNGLRRTGGFAGGRYFTVADRAGFFFGVNFCFV